MKLELTGRHVAVTPALKKFAREKLAKIEKLVLGPLDVHVILTVEKHRHIAEIVTHARNMSMSARESTGDMYTSIFECVEKLETQARRQKEKFEARRRRSKAPAEAEAEEAETEPPKARSRKSKTGAARKPASRARSARASKSSVIVASDVYPRKPMTVEEAAMQVDGSDLGFFVFRNSLSREINVLFRRKDGSLGLIEPEA